MATRENITAVDEHMDDALAAIVRSVPDIIYRLDEQGHIVYISDAVRRYGYEPDELIGCSIFDLVHPADRETATYKVNERRKGERGTRLLQLRLMTKGREAVNFELSADDWPTFLVNAEGIYAADEVEGGRFLYTQGVARDISERKPQEVEGADPTVSLRNEIALREKAQKEMQLFQFAVGHAGDAIFWFGPDGCILYANDEMYRMLGYESRELLGVHVSHISPELPGAAQWDELWEQVRNGPSPYTGQKAVWQAKDGKVFPVEVAASFFAYDGKEYVCSYVRDVSSHRRDEARREARQRLREEVWNMRSVDDIEKVIQVVRQALTDLAVPVVGCSIHLVETATAEPTVRSWRSDSADAAWVSFQNEAAVQQIVQMWQKAEPSYRPDLTKGPIEGEFERISSIFDCEIYSVLDVPFSHGTLAVNCDKLDAYSAEDVKLLQSVAEVLSEGFRRFEDLRGLQARTHDAEALAGDLRKALEREAVMGRVRDRVIAMRSISDLPEEDYWVEQLRALGIEAWGISLQFPGETDGAFKVRYLSDDKYSEDIPLAQAPWVREVWELGRSIPVSYNRMMSVGMDGWDVKNILEVPLLGVEGSLAVNTEEERPFDAEEVRVIELLAGLITEGLQRIRDFEALAERDEQLRQSQKMEAVGELAAGIAHNFNNMLQGIVGNVHLAQLEADEGLSSYLVPAQETAMRAADMVRQLMLFARKGLPQAQAPLELGEQLHETVEIARQTFDRRIRIVEEAQSDLVVRADAGQLQQLLMDLLLNARDALVGREDPFIRISWSQVLAPMEGSDSAVPCACIEVEDNGVGIPADTRERIFEPFFTTKPVDQGTGLGLSTAYGIIQQHGGRIECDSEEGTGTIFAVVLPLVQAEVSSESEALVAARGKNGGTILVVDDEAVVRESTCKLLERNGYRAFAAEGTQAVELAKREGVDLVLLDLSMPDISGTEVLAELRRSGVEAPVIFFTGYLTEADEYEGVASVLQKPFTVDELMNQVQQVLIP